MTSFQLTAAVPGVVATVVGAIEMRATPRSGGEKVRRLVPVVLALVSVVMLLLLGTFDDAIFAYESWLCGSMIALGMIVGLSGVLVRYSRKLNAILMSLVGVILACYWFLALPRA